MRVECVDMSDSTCYWLVKLLGQVEKVYLGETITIDGVFVAVMGTTWW